MKLHANAPLGPKGRERMVLRVVEQGWSIAEAAQAAGVSDRTCSKWIGRYRAEGSMGLVDRASTPKRSPTRTPEDRVQLIAALRRLRMTAAEIALCLGMALSTVSAVLRRINLGKRSRLDPPEPPNRYERARPGELLHIDVKKLGRIHGGAGHRVTGRKSGMHRARGAGWDYVHVCVDDATRLAYVEVLPDERGTTVAGFLRRAIRHYRRHGITVERVMTDNGSGYRSTLHAIACRLQGVRHLRTRPYRPRTNGKAERFIRTMIEGWAYGAIYASSAERTAALDGWLFTYNHRRPHGSLSHKPPAARLRELNNLPSSYS
ncbi:IS481 family transposase [Conexibacter woesei]|uniref:Integrase catalytic region n=1 Tax=Conexibacter woesei (strain DSM 14684 / CCUG 47730 / CIP 108061 / JCM 11494 / NBRC 100937 / ID131577) TaxID=469383 RepID=D3F650_CONWI|nr:IS481 family transposase [Conexibacter woesei]ADB48723.1 Integrase catalytic region [Conexibacter woesei DSM 14684]ADB49468.1 Integrase catalytic region [Conexibacter woesei DSM 14684]ADB49564.1 Integrase catalytic region [Conexibacter woesei DSM 14684]